MKLFAVAFLLVVVLFVTASGLQDSSAMKEEDLFHRLLRGDDDEDDDNGPCVALGNVCRDDDQCCGRTDVCTFNSVPPKVRILCP